MKPKDEQLMLLQRMRSEGRLTKAQFDELAGGRQSRTSVEEPAFAPIESEHPGQTEPDFEGAVEGEDLDEGHAPLWPPIPRTDLSANYRLGIGVISLIFIALSAFGVVSWLITILVIGVLATTLFAGWGKVTAVGGLLLAAVVVIAATSSLGSGQQNDTAPTATLAPAAPEVAPEGSLGLYMDDVTHLWNTVDGDPQIRSGITRHNEIGEFDTFIHRFGDGSQLAGAYGPTDDAVYALLASGAFPSDATAQMYLRLCFMTAPYSQDCIDAYNEQGLVGLPLEDYVDLSHQAEWMVGEHTWRLEIGQNLLAIRVYGPDAA